MLRRVTADRFGHAHQRPPPSWCYCRSGRGPRQIRDGGATSARARRNPGGRGSPRAGCGRARLLPSRRERPSAPGRTSRRAATIEPHTARPEARPPRDRIGPPKIGSRSQRLAYPPRGWPHLRKRFGLAGAVQLFAAAAVCLPFLASADFWPLSPQHSARLFSAEAPFLYDSLR